MYIRLCILILAQTLNDPTGYETIHNSISLSSRSVVIQGDDTRGPYELPDIFILEHTAVVMKDSLILESDKDYFLNPRNGTILFFEPLAKPERATIRYRFFPYKIAREYKTREISSFLQGKPIVKEKSPEEEKSSVFSEQGIVVGGAKTFSIGLNSSQGFSFDQSLRVNIGGEVAEDLSISGVLSDENTPLEPAGTTQSLEELDRIFVTIQGRGIAATLGDFRLNYHTVSTPLIQRELLGITGDISRGPANLNLAYGIPRGKFHSQYFKGTEGTQGPYQLSSTEGEEDIVVIAGTETVFLDGILLKRGEKNDYTIDYNQAQITFTSIRVITDESDIVVEFQYTRLGFKRSVYATNAAYERSNLLFSGFYVRDGDEVNQTEGFNLTKERKEFLSTIGDDTTMSWMDGGSYVGQGKGDYSFTDSFYVYRGYNQGEWDVLFTYVGQNNGDYLYSDSLSAFRYAGAQAGDYVSRVRISLPERVQLAGFELGYDTKDRVQLSGELLGSDYDRNTFSPLDDNNNKGYFTRVKTSTALLKSDWGEAFILGGYHYRNEHFRPISRIESSDFEERWNIGKQKGREELWDGGIVFQKENLFHLDANLSSLRGEHTDADLREGHIIFIRKRSPHIDLLTRSVSLRGDTTLSSVKKNRIGVSYSIWRLLPAVNAEQELVNDLSKERKREAGGQLGILIFTRSLVSFGYSKRFDDIRTAVSDRFELESRTTSRSFSFETEEFSFAKSVLSVTKRNRVYTPQFPGENTEILLIESSNRIVPWANQLAIETNYSVTGKNSVLFKEMYYEVEEGAGEYSRDSTSGVFYPDTLGNYLRKIERIGEGNPVTALQAQLHVRAAPARIIRCNLTASVLEENKGREKFPLYSLQLDRFLDDSLTEQGKQSVDGEVSLYPQDQTMLSYSAYFAKGLNNKLISTAKRDYRDRHEFRIEQYLTKKSKFSLEYKRSRQIDERISLGLQRQERKEEYLPEYSHFVLQNLEIRLKVITANVKIEEPLYYSHLGIMAIKSESIVPSFTYSLQSNALMDASFSVMRNRTPTDETSLPFDVRSFYPIGITTEWKARATLSLSRMLSMSIIYNGLNRPDKKTLHSANAELRADF
jgi:hypothetical protein